MKKHILTVLFVVVLLALTAGVAVAVWEDTKETQVAVNILPLPESTFRFSSCDCSDAVVGYGSSCHCWLQNTSPTIMTIDVITVTTNNTYITTTLQYGVGRSAVPGQAVGFAWIYLISPEAEPGPFIFDVEVTCSGE